MTMSGTLALSVHARLEEERRLFASLDIHRYISAVDLIRFGGRVDYVDLVSSSFVEESLQALGGIGISILRSLWLPASAPSRSPECEEHRATPLTVRP